MCESLTINGFLTGAKSFVAYSIGSIGSVKLIQKLNYILCNTQHSADESVAKKAIFE